MLSAETAIGQYPVEAVRAMDRIIREMERHPLAPSGRAAPGERKRAHRRRHRVGDVRRGAHAQDAADRDAHQGGFTARKVAALRPPVPILAVTTEGATYRQLALVWGVIPVLVNQVPGYDAMLTVVRDLILKREYAKSGDVS